MEKTFAVADHFEGKETVVKQIYDHLLEELRRFGPVHEAPKQTSIHLDNANGFAGVYTRKNYILLHFRTDHRIDDPRITKHEQHSARRFMHTVKLSQPADVDAQLLGWLADAYKLAG
jgi:hypothetical protein